MRPRLGRLAAVAALARQVVDGAPGDVLATADEATIRRHPSSGRRLHRRPPEGTPRNVWPGTVDGIELGPGGRARVRVAGAVPIVAEVTGPAVADLALVAETEVWVSVKASEVTSYPA